MDSSDSTDAETTRALRTARGLMQQGHSLETVLATGLIEPRLVAIVRETISREQGFELVPVDALNGTPGPSDWYSRCNRDGWHYWPELRHFLTNTKGWTLAELRSLDDSSDEVVRRLPAPSEDTSDVRGLVIGFVQSGKTANYTASIAKAADAGYRMVIVLAGIDNGLRKQTNSRLKKELVGYPDRRANAVPLPPKGKMWHEFTVDQLNGDFQPGSVNHASLQGSQPVLMVVKKNKDVLDRLINWFKGAPEDVRRTLPCLVIDDEADLASIDTRGTRLVDGEEPDQDYTPPSTINSLIRQLLGLFGRKAYVAYTATPQANILIPHDAHHPDEGADLYPKDFIIALPKPAGYFGAEEFFGRIDPSSGARAGGLDVVRHIPVDDISALEKSQLPQTLEQAIIDFALAGAARALRGKGTDPATMLVHTSPLILSHGNLRQQIFDCFRGLKDEWRYQKKHGLRDRMLARWEADFGRVTRAAYLDRIADFHVLEPHITAFLEKVEVREVNSESGDVLDYDRDPGLKAIAVGGNKLSRGLTLEGLLVSYFIRRTPTYDTLMQMGRWFGYRSGYDDLIRLYTTPELEGWFADLAFVEHQLREDLRVYDDLDLTPAQAGLRLRQHPVMQVTSRMKQRFSSAMVISQRFDLSIVQTFKFPLSRPEALASQAEANLDAVREFLGGLDVASSEGTSPSRAVWRGVSADRVIAFLNAYRSDDGSQGFSLPLAVRYIEDSLPAGELTSWTVAVCGRKTNDPKLDRVDWGVGGLINQISRSRIKDTDSLGVITDPGDEAIGLDEHQLADFEKRWTELSAAGTRKSRSVVAREVRDPAHGLLLLYPISRHSGHDADPGDNRRALYPDPKGALCRDLVGMAISFPRSDVPHAVEAYATGTVPWRPRE
jgi:hypothetical protein